MPSTPFVCAFRGRRDAYQVPLALAEQGRLDLLITDLYAQPWLQALTSLGPARLRAKIASRLEPGIPSRKVHCLWGTTAREHLRHALGYPPMMTYNLLDQQYSRVAAARARKTRSHLFLYSSYAWEAFTASYRHQPWKVLFQYHPHPLLEQRLLLADEKRYPRIRESFSGIGEGIVEDNLLRRERDVFRHADLIICASQFTRRSLLEAGADEAKCCVVPYGIERSDVVDERPAAGSFRALFVGSGGRRKGLHHLIEAWGRASLPPDSRLRLVCRMIDGEIERMAAETPGVEVIRGLPLAELNRLFAGSSVFIMPSLVEGFGQVYLEAMAQGCPVLGTPNTCLPDLGGESDGIYLVEAGNIDALISRLENLARTLPARPELREAVRTCAGRHTWSRFRELLAEALAAR